MRICHAITRLIVGGAQENTLLTCRELQARGHHVTLLAGPQTGPEGSMHLDAQVGGYDVRIVDSLRREVNPWRDWIALGKLREILGQLNPDIVHTHSSKAGILARLAARDVGVPIVVHTIHGMSFNRTQPLPVRWLYTCLERYCADFTHRFICVADAMTEQAVAAGVAPADRFVTIRSGIELTRFDPELYDGQTVRGRLGIPADAVVVATVARLAPNKGYEQLIDAVRLAAATDPRLRFLWIGDGPSRPYYQRRLDELGLADRVHMAGLVRPEQIPELLGAADMLAHASLWEGLPRVAVQALLMGRPVACFDTDGSREMVVDQHTGRLVPMGDVTILAKAICDLAADARQRTAMGRAGRQLCLQQFDYRMMVDRIEGVYFSLAGERMRPPRTGG